MPWHGDQFEYTRGYVQLLIETFYEKRSEAYAPSEDPARPSVMPYYDMLRALSSCSFTPKQWAALYLRLQGHTQFEISYLLGISRRSVRDRICLAENKIKSVLCYTANNARPEGK